MYSRFAKTRIQESLTDTRVVLIAGPRQSGKTTLGDRLIDIVLSGGYPQALERKKWARKQDWYHSYVDAIVQRDVRDVAQLEQLTLMPKLLSALAEHSGKLVNYKHFSLGLATD